MIYKSYLKCHVAVPPVVLFLDGGAPAELPEEVAGPAASQRGRSLGGPGGPATRRRAQPRNGDPEFRIPRNGTFGAGFSGENHGENQRQSPK